MADGIRKTVMRVRDLLRGHQFRYMQETDLHAAISDLLVRENIPFTREFLLTERDRLDFWLSENGIAIEVKVAGSLAAALRQVERYLEHPRVNGVLLAAARAWALRPAPPVSTGKMFAIAYLRRPFA